jgi:hypothetical protein
MHYLAWMLGFEDFRFQIPDSRLKPGSGNSESGI